jgi:hypothetical protein
VAETVADQLVANILVTAIEEAAEKLLAAGRSEMVEFDVEMAKEEEKADHDATVQVK